MIKLVLLTVDTEKRRFSASRRTRIHQVRVRPQLLPRRPSQPRRPKDQVAFFDVARAAGRKGNGGGLDGHQVSFQSPLWQLMSHRLGATGRARH